MSAAPQSVTLYDRVCQPRACWGPRTCVRSGVSTWHSWARGELAHHRCRCPLPHKNPLEDLLRPALVGVNLSEALLKIQIQVLEIRMLMFIHHHHHMVSVLGCRKVYVIQNSTLMALLDIICSPLQWNHIHLQKL
jgi:hypothetical protein